MLSSSARSCHMCISTGGTIVHVGGGQHRTAQPLGLDTDLRCTAHGGVGLRVLWARTTPPPPPRPLSAPCSSPLAKFSPYPGPETIFKWHLRCPVQKLPGQRSESLGGSHVKGPCFGVHEPNLRHSATYRQIRDTSSCWDRSLQLLWLGSQPLQTEGNAPEVGRLLRPLLLIQRKPLLKCYVLFPCLRLCSGHRLHVWTAACIHKSMPFRER